VGKTNGKTEWTEKIKRRLESEEKMKQMRKKKLNK
jgi:hypothetical protein